MSDVVVLLPGITGSVLQKNGRMVWGWSGRSALRGLLDGGRSMTRSLLLPGDPMDLDDLGDDVEATSLISDLHLIPGLWKIDGYSRIATTIRAGFEVEEGRNFFEFPYDWRRDNRVAARRLARMTHDWLTGWRQSSGNADAKLILVAHSMGGLVSRYFLEVMEGWKKTRALITFGTPYRGSLNALNSLANGEKKGPGGRIDVSELLRSFTSVYQLLPIYECYDSGDGSGLQRVGEAVGIPNVDAQRAAEALAFHREIEHAVESNTRNERYRKDRYAIFPIVGTHQPTFQAARRAGAGVEMLYSLADRDLKGDGTVPRVSATPIELSRERREMFASTSHGSLQNADAVLTHLAGVISGLAFDLGGFRDTRPRPPLFAAHLGMRVEDLYDASEPIGLTLEVHGDPGPLTATVTELESGVEMARAEIAGAGSKRHLELAPLPAGAYRIRVFGGTGVEPVENTVTVLGPLDERAPLDAPAAEMPWAV
jgi:pimeloyl-ACP methyl ester carboxylesterase